MDPGVADFVRALDAATLTDDDFDGLLAAAGLLGDPSAGLALPEAMAPVNALLDLAAPALREALLTAFLDRLPAPGLRAAAYPCNAELLTLNKWYSAGEPSITPRYRAYGDP